MGLSLKTPSRERSEKRAKAAAEKLGEGEKRIVADVPEHIHRQVRASVFSGACSSEITSSSCSRRTGSSRSLTARTLRKPRLCLDWSGVPVSNFA